MKFRPVALATLALLFSATAAFGKKPKDEPAPPERPLPATLLPERKDAAPFPALMVKARKPVGAFLTELKALSDWAAAKKIAGTPFFYIYDGPCDGNAQRWISDAGLMLDAAPAPGFDPGPYEYRMIPPPSARMVRMISAATSISGEVAAASSAPGAPAAGTPFSDPNDARSGVRHACKLIADSEKEFYQMKPEQHFLPPAMIMIALHGMKRFALDEPVSLEIRVPHYDLDANGRMPGPTMPTPIQEKPPQSAASAASAPAPVPGKKKPARKTASAAGPAAGKKPVTAASAAKP